MQLCLGPVSGHCSYSGVSAGGGAGQGQSRLHSRVCMCKNLCNPLPRHWLQSKAAWSVGVRRSKTIDLLLILWAQWRTCPLCPRCECQYSGHMSLRRRLQESVRGISLSEELDPSARDSCTVSRADYRADQLACHWVSKQTVRGFPLTSCWLFLSEGKLY